MVKASPPDPFLRLPSYLVFEMVRLARRTSAEMYPDEGLRLPQAAALACLSVRGPMSQRELSEALRLDPGDLVAVIDALEQRGYVVRERDQTDRRRYSLQVTDEGRLALHERRNRGVRLNDTLFAPLAPHEREQLQELLLRVLAHHDPRFAEGGACAHDAAVAEQPAPEQPPQERWWGPSERRLR
ncbi:MAG TPA: MarR family transcriptional regulator [Streptosporangiaceae bacterium]